MEKEQKYIALTVLSILFVIISIIHVVYASATWRGLYEDGAFYAVSILNSLADNHYKLITDIAHPRCVSPFFTQLPLWVMYFFGISGKKVLLTTYSFMQFFLPLLILFWHYRLTKRTEKTHVFFFHLFTYCAIVLPYSIFSVVESIIGFGTQFILWNYLVSDIEYKKRDLAGILICLVFLFGTYEYVLFLGPLIFLFHFQYAFKSLKLKEKLVKTLIGHTAFIAAVYNVVFMFGVPDEDGEITRFIGETVNWLPYIFSLCSLYSVIAFAAVIGFSAKKTKIPVWALLLTGLLFLSAGIYLFYNPQKSIYPMWEQHIRAYPCIFVPLFFIILKLIDNTKNTVKYKNLMCIALMCGIMQTAHQIIGTYYWDKNVQYMKSELAKVDSPLYVPSEHDIIGDFHTKTLRRYLWHGVYASTSIAFSDTYKQKTLLLSYDTMQDDGNPEGREYLYLTKDKKLSVPFGVELDLKNRYWDLTECAYALDKYNKENNIHTFEDE